eukprot:TRINITY_DN4570_c0_g1_i1.p1 TRINITY_DN4570_c0_g1~~TRINITY_DN4570_c0_g1_i1.p1  ORF type:complete len:981 (-),score=223.06 TRINITY_DN4570_c0_g1_i1:236-3178(-)
MSLAGAGVFGGDAEGHDDGVEMKSLKGDKSSKSEKQQSTEKKTTADKGSKNLLKKGKESVVLNFHLRLSQLTIAANHTLTQPKIRFCLAPASSTLRDGRKKRARNLTIFEWTTEKAQNVSRSKSIEFRKTLQRKVQLTEDQTKTHFLFFELLEESLPAEKQHVGSAALNVQKVANGPLRQDFQILGESDASRKKNVVALFSCEIFLQEETEFKIHFQNWSGLELLAADDTGTSDPFVEFSIKKDWHKVHRKGGYFGRACTSSKVMNTLYPFWKDCGSISYFGTRSELEMEELLINVYDWDLTTNDHIGFAKVPVRSFLEKGHIEVSLKMTQPVPGTTSADVGKYAGKLTGSVTITGSQFAQTLDKNILIPGYRYLFVNIISAQNLPATDPNGFTDCFAIVEYDKTKYQTAVKYRDLNPEYNETFIYPVILSEETPKMLSKKGKVVVTCYDKDDQGNDYLGDFTVPIQQIFTSATRKMENVTTRVFEGPIPLLKLGESTKATFQVRAWFSPDFPPEFTMDSIAEENRRSDITVDQKLRATAWRELLSHNMDQTSIGFPFSVIDEQGIERFIPSYISPLAAPRDMQTPESIMRMVHAITFETDKSSFEVKEDVWMSPARFLDMKKGDSEEHAILMTNLLLGIGYDAYCCIGRTKKNQIHTWVMIREQDCSVSFWETTNGKKYNLPNKWRGKRTAEISSSVNLPDVKQMEKTLKKAQKRAAIEDDDSAFLFSDSEEIVTAEEMLKNNEGIIETRQGAALSMYQHAEEIKNLLPYSTLEVIFNHHNLWGNSQSLIPELANYNLDDDLEWKPFLLGQSDQVRPFYDIIRIPPRLSVVRIAEMQKSLLQELRSRVVQARQDVGLETSFISDFEPVLERGLQICEDRAGGQDRNLDFLAWQGEISSLVPPGYEFKGVPLCFSYTDSFKIAEVILRRTDLHKDDSQDCKHAMGALIISHPNAVCNAWVYFAKVFKGAQKDNDSQNKAE